MNKILLISLLLFSLNGWTQTSDEVHERCKDTADYVGCVETQEASTPISKDKSVAAYINKTPEEFLEENIILGSDLFPICNLNKIIEAKQVITFEPPEIISRIKTMMPTTAMRRNIDGIVIGKIAIDENGGVTDIEVIYSFPDVNYFKVNFSSSRKKYKYKPAVDLESGKNIKSFLYDFQVYTSPKWLGHERREQNLNMGGLGVSYLNTLFSVWDKTVRGYLVSAKESVTKKYQKENDPLKKTSYFYLNAFIDLLDIYQESWDEKGNKAWSVEGDFNQQRFKAKFQSFNDTAIKNFLTTRKMYTDEVDKSIYNYFNPLVLKMRFATSMNLYRLYVDSYQDDLAYEEASKNLLIKRNFGLEISDDDYAMYTFIGITASNRKDWCNAYYAFSSANQIKDFIDKEFLRQNDKRRWLFQDITAELNAKFEDKDNRISAYRDYIDDKEREKYFKKAEYEFELVLNNTR
jgi:hypothetical protein